MNEAFLIFLSLSISGSLVALLLLFLKPLVKNQLSKTWQYYIFLIVVVRLLLPFGPETSLMGMVFNQSDGYIVSKNGSAAIPDADHIPQTLPTELPETQQGNNAVVSPLLTANIEELAFEWLWLAWLLLRKIVGYLCFCHSVKTECTDIENDRLLEIYWEVCREMRIKHPPVLSLNEKVAAPMLVGAIRPVIVLAVEKWNDTDIHYILQHELTHYKRLDIVYKWLVQVVICLHWYNPFVYWISREVNRNCELSCDEAVIRRLNVAGQRAYGDMLLKTIKLTPKTPRSVVSITLSEDTKLIKDRLGAIMKHRKKSRMVVIISALLAITLLCCATFTGVYASAKPASSADLENISTVSPIIIDTNMIEPGGKIALGSQRLLTGTVGQVSLEWDGDSNLTVLCTPPNGVDKAYHIENGKTFTFQVDADGEYTVAVKNVNENNIRNIKGNITFEQNALTQQPSRDANVASQVSTANEQTVIYQNTEIRQYEGEGAHPYIHDIRTNNTDKTIIEIEHVMLAFDKYGEPLKVDWWSQGTSQDSFYLCLYREDFMKFLPGEKMDMFGGWSLNIMGKDPAVDQIAYVLFCDKEITFEDGSVWKNPDSDEWLQTYEGKTIDVEVLENYYPYEQKIDF